jgi:hypothetical protein
VALNGMLPSPVTQPANFSLEDRSKPQARIAAKILSVLYILFSLEAGIFLLWLPWQHIWENNYIVYLYPQIRPWVANPFFKGAVLGLGIDNILMGIRQIVHFKNTSKGSFPW